MTYVDTSESYHFYSDQSYVKPSSENSLAYNQGLNNCFKISDYAEELSSRGHVVEVDQLFSLFHSAKLFADGIDQDRLKAALFEAIRLKSSGLFPSYIEPQIAVDEHGEFMFTFKNSVGYIDIGLSGEGEISFHARNDQSPEYTAYGDVQWDGLSLPYDLIESATPILKY